MKVSMAINMHPISSMTRRGLIGYSLIQKKRKRFCSTFSKNSQNISNANSKEKSRYFETTTNRHSEMTSKHGRDERESTSKRQCHIHQNRTALPSVLGG